MRRRLIISLLALPVGLLGLEALLRFALFHPSDLARSLGADLRQPGYFASPADHTGEAYWKLYCRFEGGLENWAQGNRHPSLGWSTSYINPETMSHRDAELIEGRRPLLLYGSSHAKFTPNTTLRYRRLLEESPLGEEYALVNHAVSGYGLGQTLAMFERSVDLYAPQRPVVAFTVMIDHDVARAPLGFRNAPQPRLDLDELGNLVLIEADTIDTEEYLAEHPIGIRSYLWNFLVYGTTLFSGETARRLRRAGESDQLRRSILHKTLERVQLRCEDLGLTYFVVILQSQRTVENVDGQHWLHAALHSDLVELGIPFVATAPMIRAAAADQGRAVEDFYFQDVPGNGHPNDLGMRVLFGAYARGLRGEFD